MTKYTQGYSIGVGGIVCWGDKILLVKGMNDVWQLPGGYVERDETFDDAVIREVHEEAGVLCEVDGIVAARNRTFLSESELVNDTYIAFKLTPPDSPEVRPDGIETKSAKFMHLDEIQSLDRCPEIFKNLAKIALDRPSVLIHQDLSSNPRKSYSFYSS